MLLQLRLIVFSIFFSLFGVGTVCAQGIPTAGTSFTFAIPEGADKVSAEFTPSRLVLIIVSPHSGDGVIYSPSGVEIPFSFTANRAAQVELPHKLMHLDDLGKTNKGILVRTTQPVNLTYYLINPSASESSQIFPDDVLGTSYLVTGWGIWNDSSDFFGIYEDNRNQIVVIAKEDGTDVTMIPKVACLGGYDADLPVLVRLNKGETFILKADIFGQPNASSLSNSRVTSTKPVSVMMASTCAYVPLALQACNPLVDHLLPTSLVADTLFYVSPPSDPTHDCRIVFISETPQFYVVNSKGTLFLGSGGRLVVPHLVPDVYRSTVPVTCHLLSSGTDNFWISDPSIAPVLPRRAWGDTLMWLAPMFPTSFGFVVNYVSLVYPTADSQNIFIDSDAITRFPTHIPIGDSTYSVMIAAIKDGEHRVHSRVPVFGMMSGFDVAEAYMSVMTGIAPALPSPPNRPLLIESDSAKTCHSFTTSVSLTEPILTTENVYQYRLVVTYDGRLMQPTSITPSPSVASIASVDNLSPDTIRMTVLSPVPLALSGELLKIVFEVFTSAEETTLRASSTESELDYAFLTSRRGAGQETVQIHESRGVQDARLSIILRSVVLGDTTTGMLFLETPLVDTLSELRVLAHYDHDVIDIFSVKTQSTILAGWDVVIHRIDSKTDEFVFTHPLGASLVKGKGLLGFLRATTYVTDTNATEFLISGFFRSASPCPLDFNALDTTGAFTGIDKCGDEYLHEYMKTIPLSITKIIPSPIRSDFVVTLTHKLPHATTVDIELLDMLGNTVWKTSKLTNAGPIQDMNISLPATIPNGSYVLSLTAQGQRVSSAVIVLR